MTNQPPYRSDPAAPEHLPQSGYTVQLPQSGYTVVPYSYAYPRRTNMMAILALVFAFVVAPAAIVLGHIARKQIRQTGEEGDGLALAGLIVGYALTGLSVVFCGLYGAFVVGFFLFALSSGA